MIKVTVKNFFRNIGSKTEVIRTDLNNFLELLKNNKEPEGTFLASSIRNVDTYLIIAVGTLNTVININVLVPP